MQRNTTIAICRAIAIILMVMGHAASPDTLQAFLYEFHMPVFFITAGYFFSRKYLNDEATFVKKRIRGLYLPFVKWSVFFLIIHNWMFDLGVMNEKYGNVTGGVTHPYSWHQMQQNLWNIITAMGGYDEFLIGAFWFFRGLLVASLLYLVLFKLFDNLAHKVNKLQAPLAIPIAICVVMLLLCGWKTAEGLNVINIVQGGYRDMMGCFFFGTGYIFRRLENKYTVTWYHTIFFALVVYLFSEYATSSMHWRSTFTQFISLPIPAILGFLMTYNISKWIDKKENMFKRFMVYCGNNTMSIFVLHILSFKIVSLIKIAYYNMDIQQVGCHMVIHEHAKEDMFWILYTIVGVGLPLALHYLYTHCTIKK